MTGKVTVSDSVKWTETSGHHKSTSGKRVVVVVVRFGSLLRKCRRFHERQELYKV